LKAQFKFIFKSWTEYDKFVENQNEIMLKNKNQKASVLKSSESKNSSVNIFSSLNI
jgi:hypothetical protein